MPAEYIYHLVQSELWADAVARGATYFPPTYEQDGFTHGTANPAVLLNVANHFYVDVPGEWQCLMMTVESLAASGVKVVFEDRAAVGNTKAEFDGTEATDTELFPHLFGGIHPAAVLAIFPVERNAAGNFLAVPGVTD